MELTQHGFLEELLAPRRETWSSFPSELLIPSGWNFDSLEENPTLAATNPSFVGFSTPAEATTFECPFSDQAAYPFLDHGFTVPEIDSSSYTKNETCSFPPQEDYNPSIVEDEELGYVGSDHHHSLELERKSSCCIEMEQASNSTTTTTATTQIFNMGLYGERKSKAKKIEGQPSKNLMAERRRRKRLNDRLSMLRSIVPKISKMDRTSILGDTIDYMKELLERINKLQEEETEGVTSQILMGNLKEQKQNEVMVRNSPKFDVERKEIDTRIDICCAAKPGLLLSTVSTLEALGIEIQQCVISCFNDFSMQASCSEVGEQRTLLSSEDIKQALFRNAGYGGRCL